MARTQQNEDLPREFSCHDPLELEAMVTLILYPSD